jgi:EAL domain-containing protein (putative c-di-GMP-specific phosphodiesterase class I)/GGDEF domain-containing protein
MDKALSGESPTLRVQRLDAALLELSSILAERRLVTLYQPIVDARTRRVHGFEALTRGPSDSWLHSPMNLFAAARQAGVWLDLELLCIELALARADRAGARGRIFVNVSPDTIAQSPDFAERLRTAADACGVRLDRCVLELTEENLLDDYRELGRQLDDLRAVGCEVAIDDLGAGRSGLRTWSELKPDYVKIDRYFISNIDSDSTKCEFVRSIIDMGRAIGSRVLAEGVETEGESRELLELGIDYLQGYFIARPAATVVSEPEALASLDRWSASQPALTAEHLAEHVPPVPPDMRVCELVERFRASLEHDAFPVVSDGRPLGVVRREALFSLLSKPLYPEIYNRKPVTTVMESPTLTIDARLRLDQVSRLITRRSNARVSDHFVIARGGQYLGMAATMNLLRQITEQQVQTARQSNPLTMLPGNALIRERIARLLAAGERFIACYVDLDAFKPYNDHHGYARGDQVILLLAQLLKDAMSGRVDFVGHVGGDDFILLMRSGDWESRLGTVLARFVSASGRISADTERAGDELATKAGDRELPPLSLSIAAIDPLDLGLSHVDAIAATLAEVKKVAKAISGCSFVMKTSEGIVDLARSDSCDASGAA